MNSKQEEMQKRARRLIEFVGSPRDLDLLLLWLRDKTHGNHSVRDLGNFVGHPDKRSKGVASDRVRAFHNQVAFHFRRLSLSEDELRALNPALALIDLKRAALGSLATSTDHEIRQHTGYSRKRAKSILEKLLNTARFTDGCTIDSPPMSTREFQVFDTFVQTLVVKPAFVEQSLAEEFANCLKLNNLVPPNYKISDKFVSRIAAYTISKLHHVHVELENGLVSRLETRYDPHSAAWHLKVDAHVAPFDRDLAASVSFSMFETTLNAREWCEQELLVSHVWQFPVELGENWKLRIV